MGNRFYFLRYVGLAPWAANAEIYFRDNRICRLSVALFLEIKKVGGDRVGFDLSTRQSSETHEEFVISDGHVTGGNRYVFYGVKTITLPADATPAERAHAFGYDLSCVAKLGGCQDLTQVLDLKAIMQSCGNGNRDPVAIGAAPASRGQSVMAPTVASRASPYRKIQRKKIGRALPAPAFEVYALADVFRANF